MGKQGALSSGPGAWTAKGSKRGHSTIHVCIVECPHSGLSPFRLSPFRPGRRLGCPTLIPYAFLGGGLANRQNGHSQRRRRQGRSACIERSLGPGSPQDGQRRGGPAIPPKRRSRYSTSGAMTTTANTWAKIFSTDMTHLGRG